MHVTAREINEKQFHDAWRGYNQEEVDDFLDHIAETVEDLERETTALKARVDELDQKVEASKGTEEMIKKTLASAQAAAQEAIATAKSKAEQIVQDAEERVQRARNELKTRVETAEEEVRRRTREVEAEQEARRRGIQDSVDRLQAFEGELRRKVKSFLDQQMQAMHMLEERGAPDRLEIHDEPISLEWDATEPASQPAVQQVAEDDEAPTGTDEATPRSEDEPSPNAEVAVDDDPEVAADADAEISVVEPDRADETFDVPGEASLDDFAPYDEDEAFGPGRKRRRGLFRREPRDAGVTSEEA